MGNKKPDLKKLSKFFFLEACGFLVLAGIIHFTAPYLADTPEKQEAARVMFYCCIIMSPFTTLLGLHSRMRAKRLEEKRPEEEAKKYKPIG